MKHPKTPDEIADELLAWYARGQGGLVRFCKIAQPDVEKQANIWFEKGRARILSLAEAIRNLDT